MTENRPLDVILCWHMHQPQYRRSVDGRYQLPWTYLHAVKDYTDMAWHIERCPEARAVVNFTPVLLDQLDDYATQFATSNFRDPLLAALAQPELVAAAERPEIVAALFRANVERMVNRFPPYARLYDLYRSALASDQADSLSDAYIGDAVVWYHLAWLGETVRRTDVVAQRLVDKALGYDAADRAAMLEVLGSAISGVVPRYHALAEQGRIELSTSPYAHPILPLLIDFAAARESLPDAPLPVSASYPGGALRAAEHLRAAIDSHRAHFGTPPAGCWPSEGGISRSSIALTAAAGFAWTASCESVLVRSLQTRDGGLSPRPDYLYKPYRVKGDGIELPCFFRDMHLSDLIGFRYAQWHGDDAVANLVGELEGIAESTASQEAPVVSIILDGENAWEHYPENGYYFLSGLYRAISSSRRLRLTTFSEYLRRKQPGTLLDGLVAGSWVYGTFSTWIGDPEKNRAWDLLARAKTDFDRALTSGLLSATEIDRAEAQLKVCEGSDWFWWFGDYNPLQTVSNFDRLFRDHVRDLYALIRLAPPAEIDSVIGVGGGAPVHGGTMRENVP
jgi:alpha-amylase/alpha-mannosidase (GH57 family)